MNECPKEDCQGSESFFRHHDAEANVNVYECENCGDEFEVPV